MTDCASCVFSAPTVSDLPDEGPLLKCHRYPPTLFVIDGELMQAFPEADEPCGEHRETLPSWAL